jgi:hypothetical protein
VPADRQAGPAPVVFRLSPEDIGRFETLRESAYAICSGGKSVTIGLGVAAKEFCRTGAQPSAPLLATTYLRTSEPKAYVVVTKNLDLMTDSATSSEMMNLAPCNK